MTEAVLADAQFGTLTTLRPFSGFDEVYQGQPVTRPILFTPNGEMLDAQAGKSGYRSQLVRGLAVPLGARVIVYLPLVTARSGNVFPVGHLFYKWFFYWRFRNLFDYRTARTPYHLPKQSLGFQATDPAAESEVVIPAVGQPVVYTQEETTTFVRQCQDIKPFEDVKARGRQNLLQPPLIRRPGTAVENAVIQQGLPPLQQFGAVQANSPGFMVHELQALGDELIVGLYRDEDIPNQDDADEPATNAPNWDFQIPGQGNDASLPALFGDEPTQTQTGIQYPIGGVYVTVGSAP